jgi:glycosyltransferase involved in cell wall biosynthesis
VNSGRAQKTATDPRAESPSFLVLLYGTLEYDGRAQRMLEVLKKLGRVTVVDVADQGVDQTNGVADVRRVQVYLQKRANKISRHILFWWAALRVAQRVKPSVVVAENFFTTLPGWISARYWKSKLVYDAYELIIPDSTCPMSKRDRFWYLLERWTVRRADLVIAANEERASLMAEHYCLKQMPTVMHNIPGCTKAIARTEEMLRRFPVLFRRTTDEVLVIYQGDISLSRGIARFIRALAFLGPEYRLIIVGGGPDLERLKAIGEPFEREGRFVMLGRIPHRQLSAITVMADIGIVTYPYQGLNNIYCAPNKLFEYTQAGLPVVATDQPPLRRLVENYGIGRLIGEHDSPEQIAEVIREVAENKKTYVKALTRFLTDHRWEEETERVREAIVSILTDKWRRTK